MTKIIRKLLSNILGFYYQIFLSNGNSIKLGKNTLLFSKLKVNGSGNKIELGNDCTLRKTLVQINGKNNKIIFSNKVKVYEGLKILIESDHCLIKIGDFSTIGSAKLQLGEEDTKIIIGEDCMLSREIIINTSDFHSIIDLEDNKRINPAKDVIIGNHNWIGNGVYINKGAIISDNSIIAARSVVPAKNFESNSVIGGIPAKVIKSNVNWDRKLIK